MHTAVLTSRDKIFLSLDFQIKTCHNINMNTDLSKLLSFSILSPCKTAEYAQAVIDIARPQLDSIADMRGPRPLFLVVPVEGGYIPLAVVGPNTAQYATYIAQFAIRVVRVL